MDASIAKKKSRHVSSSSPLQLYQASSPPPPHLIIKAFKRTIHPKKKPKHKFIPPIHGKKAPSLDTRSSRTTTTPTLPFSLQTRLYPTLPYLTFHAYMHQRNRALHTYKEEPTYPAQPTTHPTSLGSIHPPTHTHLELVFFCIPSPLPTSPSRRGCCCCCFWSHHHHTMIENIKPVPSAASQPFIYLG